MKYGENKRCNSNVVNLSFINIHRGYILQVFRGEVNSFF
jgi:hypothetical protein